MAVVAWVCLFAGMLFIGFPVIVFEPLRYFGAGILIGCALQLLMLTAFRPRLW